MQKVGTQLLLCQQASFDYAHSLRACSFVPSKMGIDMVVARFSTNFVICKPPHTASCVLFSIIVGVMNVFIMITIDVYSGVAN